MSVTPSPNMNMPVPGVGTESGPEWANDLNSCLSILDSHDHSSGYGVAISPSGLNINSDLTINNNNLIDTKSLRFFEQSAVLSGPSDLGCIYDVLGELYYNDGAGNQVQITSGGAVAGTPGSIANLVSPASASYVSADETFVWQSDANKPANLDAGFIILRNNVASSKGLTLEPPLAMGSDFAITLPTLPASTSAVNITSSGGMGTISYDGIGQGMTATGANAIGVSMTSSGANAVADSRTRTVSTTVGAGGVAISTACSSFSTSSTSLVDVTNLSVTITTTGRPIFLGIIGDASNQGYIRMINGSSSSTGAQFYFVEGAGALRARLTPGASAGGATAILEDLAPGVFWQVYPASAATYSFKFSVQCNSGTTVSVNNVKLIAYEL